MSRVAQHLLRIQSGTPSHKGTTFVEIERLEEDVLTLEGGRASTRFFEYEKTRGDIHRARPHRSHEDVSYAHGQVAEGEGERADLADAHVLAPTHSPHHAQILVAKVMSVGTPGFEQHHLHEIRAEAR